MIRLLTIMGCLFLLTSCSTSDLETVPHNSVVVDDELQDIVLFTFNQADRFSRSEMAHGVSLELTNQSSLLLETDFELTLDYFDDGWTPLESVDFFTRTHAYSLERNHRIRQTVYTDHFNNELESGRYRIRVDYSLKDEDNVEQGTYSIGAVFWLID
ncbi:immunoglobulin-like domain-containing protein [Alkalibacterium olivapovliticus]|uniref:Bacterial Ig-like domain-containing protein n=1 Tax=Alkalibacterium olivapovliticus TaxID=99907 RepID=A0A2T0W7E1_9LACT|nr:immunoglobulin-like domain-containing protein [Alkalibacterium olivapovliticus]PRY82628.1 hypothetical protein CLV38_11089 [Alkalibacterium olivapovliticus]